MSPRSNTNDTNISTPKAAFLRIDTLPSYTSRVSQLPPSYSFDGIDDLHTDAERTTTRAQNLRRRCSPWCWFILLVIITAIFMVAVFVPVYAVCSSDPEGCKKISQGKSGWILPGSVYWTTENTGNAASGTYSLFGGKRR